MFRISPALHPDTPALHNPAMSRASLALHPKKFAFNFGFFCGDLWCLYFLSDFWRPLERFFFFWLNFVGSLSMISKLAQRKLVKWIMEASAAKISKTCFSESNMFEKHSAMFRIFWNMVKQNFQNMINDKLYQSKLCYISCFSCSQSPKRAGRCSPRSGSMRPAPCGPTGVQT